MYADISNYRHVLFERLFLIEEYLNFCFVFDSEQAHLKKSLMIILVVQSSSSKANYYIWRFHILITTFFAANEITTWVRSLWNTCQSLAGQHIPWILWNPKNNHRLSKSQQLASILSQNNPVQSSHHFIYFHLHPGLPRALFPSSLQTKVFKNFSFPHACYMFRTCHLSSSHKSNKVMENSTNDYAPHYAISSTIVLFHLRPKYLFPNSLNRPMLFPHVERRSFTRLL
jgi:hypothetical protein